MGKPRRVRLCMWWFEGCAYGSTDSYLKQPYADNLVALIIEPTD
jgi:hypothetical protein